jgi:hypothetical protein
MPRVAPAPVPGFVAEPRAPRASRARVAVLVLLGVALVVGAAAIWLGVTGTIDPANHEPPMYPRPSPDPTLSGMPPAP